MGQFILLILGGKVQCTFVIPFTLKSRKGTFNRMYFHHTFTSAVGSPTLPLPCQCHWWIENAEEYGKMYRILVTAGGRGEVDAWNMGVGESIFFPW